jgi:serine/threonine protein kinase
MPEIGQTLSHYRILEKIGEGGMGEVYLADDTTLDRKVALKFLPDAFTSDPERMARFEREAKLLASLNHPNIAGIYGLEQADGNRFLVLEYVEGETLQARLSKGALPLEDALALCRQIAEGLEAAHEKGVIHRDLKPANVMITAEEKVKILDFGLAKAFSDDTQSIDSSQSPTLTEAMTQPGVILGTAAYMSPEQAKGKSVDKRADIWAFGCILYECLTGKKAFEGETVTETLAAVIRGEPEWEALPTTVPTSIRTLLKRCLYKDRHNRLPHMGSVRLEIDEVDTSAALPVSMSWKAHIWRERIAWIVVGLVVITILLNWNSKQQEEVIVSYPSIHLELPLPDQLFTIELSELSPDGRNIAYLSRSASMNQLAIMNLETMKPTLVPDSELAANPFWSPDSQAVGFRSSDGKLKTYSISGGMPRELPLGDLIPMGGASWAEDGTIIFATGNGIFKVDRSSSTDPQQLTHVDQSRKEKSHICPRFLPDSNHFFYTVTGIDGDSSSIFLASLDGDDPRRIVEGSGGIYLSGHLLYVLDGRLLARACNLKSLDMIGEPIEIASGISMSTIRGPAFSAVSSGLVVYSTSGSRQPSQIIEYDRSGHPLRLIGDAGKYANPDLDTEEKHLIFNMERESEFYSSIYSLRLDKTVFQQFTFGHNDHDPVWSPDSTQIAYGRSEDNKYGLYIMDAIPDGKSEQVLESEVTVYPCDWSPDGDS